MNTVGAERINGSLDGLHWNDNARILTFYENVYLKASRMRNLVVKNIFKE